MCYNIPMSEINELIKMYAFFDHSKIIPIAFSWQGRRYEKLKQISSWEMRRGQYLDQWFSLSDGVNTYHVRFNGVEHNWRLMEILTD